MEKAIKLSIEGGYSVSNAVNSRWAERAEEKDYSNIVIDPLFWQALGKVEGWGKTKNFTGQRKDSLLNLWPEEWQVYWHCFIDGLIEGKNKDSFFEELLEIKCDLCGDTGKVDIEETDGEGNYIPSGRTRPCICRETIED